MTTKHDELRRNFIPCGEFQELAEFQKDATKTPKSYYATMQFTLFRSTTFLKWYTLLSYIIMVTCNFVQIGPHSVGEVSRKYNTPITPAGWAFAIWSVIFLLQGQYSTNHMSF